MLNIVDANPAHAAVHNQHRHATGKVAIAKSSARQTGCEGSLGNNVCTQLATGCYCLVQQQVSNNYIKFLNNELIIYLRFIAYLARCSELLLCCG